MQNIHKIEFIIGRPVVSLETANKLGRIADLLVDPLSGQLAGLSVRRADGTYALASILDVHDIGPDAVIVERDEALVLVAASPLNKLPRARRDLVGVKVITDRGQILGAISNLYLCIEKRPVFIYEIRSSFIDMLLGRRGYFAGSHACAFSTDRRSLVVNNAEQLDRQVIRAARRVAGPYNVGFHPAAAFDVQVRTHPH